MIPAWSYAEAQSSSLILSVGGEELRAVSGAGGANEKYRLGWGVPPQETRGSVEARRTMSAQQWADAPMARRSRVRFEAKLIRGPPPRGARLL